MWQQILLNSDEKNSVKYIDKWAIIILIIYVIQKMIVKQRKNVCLKSHETLNIVGFW